MSAGTNSASVASVKVRARGRVGSYAWWQFRDYMLGPAIWTLVVSLLLVVFPMVLLKTSARPKTDPTDLLLAATQMFDTSMGIFAFLGPMLAIGALVSADRVPGMTRFLFAKPVNASRYYFQMWCARTVGLLGIAFLVAFGINQFIIAVPWLEGVESVAIAWLLIGGVGFLVSSLMAQDVGVLVIIYLIPDLLNQIIPQLPGWSWLLKPLLNILPPMHKLADIRHALIRHLPMPQQELWHVLIFGAVSAALATYLVRRLPLVR